MKDCRGSATLRSAQRPSGKESPGATRRERPLSSPRPQRFPAPSPAIYRFLGARIRPEVGQTHAGQGPDQVQSPDPADSHGTSHDPPAGNQHRCPRPPPRPRDLRALLYGRGPASVVLQRPLSCPPPSRVEAGVRLLGGRGGVDM